MQGRFRSHFLPFSHLRSSPRSPTLTLLRHPLEEEAAFSEARARAKLSGLAAPDGPRTVLRDGQLAARARLSADVPTLDQLAF